MIIWLIFVIFLQTKPSFCLLFACPSWTFLPKYLLSEYTRCGEGGEGGVRMETSIVSVVGIGRNCLLGNGKKIAKFLMRTFTYRSTFLYAVRYQVLLLGIKYVRVRVNNYRHPYMGFTTYFLLLCQLRQCLTIIG